jgi:prepilin-type N-terminal cleavage/methylation domain-containing protein
MEQGLLKQSHMNGPHAARAKTRGFTLIEMLVVIGIIATMAAVSLPNIVGFLRTSRIRSAQDEVFTAVQKARIKAISQNTQYGVTFVIESTSAYWIHVEDPIIATAGQAGTTGRQAIVTASPNTTTSVRYVLDPRVRFAVAASSCPGNAAAGNQASLRFDRFGARYFPGTAPAVSDPAVPALAGTPTTANGILITNSSSEATICLVDQQTQLFRLITIGPGGRVKKG